MNKTMKAMMKPIDPATVRANSENPRRQQEAIVLTILQDSPYSMTSRDIGKAIDLPSFPGCDVNTYAWMPIHNRATCMASRVCKRLEAKGKIISTLYQGARLYSIPVDNQ